MAQNSTYTEILRSTLTRGKGWFAILGRRSGLLCGSTLSSMAKDGEAGSDVPAFKIEKLKK
jgi:hypothetical protein